MLNPIALSPWAPKGAVPTRLVKIGGTEAGARRRPIPVWANKRAMPKKITNATSKKTMLQIRLRPLAQRKPAMYVSPTSPSRAATRGEIGLSESGPPLMISRHWRRRKWRDIHSEIPTMHASEPIC